MPSASLANQVSAQLNRAWISSPPRSIPSLHHREVEANTGNVSEGRAQGPISDTGCSQLIDPHGMGLLQAVVFKCWTTDEAPTKVREHSRTSWLLCGWEKLLKSRVSFHHILRRCVYKTWHILAFSVIPHGWNRDNCFHAETQERKMEGYIQKYPHPHDTLFGRLYIFRSLEPTRTHKCVYTIAWCGRLTKATEGKASRPQGTLSLYLVMASHSV